jgi:hypothetical protein
MRLHVRAGRRRRLRYPEISRSTAARPSLSRRPDSLRALRPGYLYTYDEKRRRLRAYMVLEDGIMWSFTPGQRSPQASAEGLMTQGCANRGDLAFETLGRCVDVEHTPGVDEATNLWIGWSNVQWTPALVESVYQESWRKLHMQCVNVPSMMAGSAVDTGEFRANYGKVAHFAMDEQAVKAAFDFSNRDTQSEIRQRRRNLPNRIGDAMAESPNKKGFVVAVNDPVGVANDLSELTVPSANNGFDEDIYWKATSAQLIQRAEMGIRARARESTRMSYAVSKEIQQVDMNPGFMAPGSGGGAADLGQLYRLATGFFKTGSLTKAMEDDNRRAADVPAAQQEAEDDDWLEASTRINEQGKRVPVLDERALKEEFPKQYQQALDAFHPAWHALAQAHADWLNCQLLSDWMLGNTDRQDIRSGYAYSESCAQAIGAGAGTEMCMKVLNDWLSESRLSNTRNIFARALAFNQDDLMNSADAKIHGSDIQYENFMNIYKGSVKKFEDRHGQVSLRDRLVLTAGNVIVATLSNAAESAGKKLVMIRLHI